MSEQIECLGKHPFPSKVIAESTFNRKRTDVTLKTYQCPHCGFWHIAHTKKDLKLKRRV